MISKHVFGFAALALSLVACPSSPPPITADCTLSSNITTPTTLSPSVCSSYTVTKPLDVTAALTIQPGTTLKFASSAGLQIEATGSLNATGTVALPITFTGTMGTSGFWRGLVFRSNDTANKLVYANILYAGSETFCCDYEDKAAVTLGGNILASPVQVTMANTTINGSGGYGVYLFETGSLPGFTSNTFKSNTQAPVSLPISRVENLDSTTVYSGGAQPNTQQFVRVLQADNDTNVTQTMRKLDVPYRISAGVAGKQLRYNGALTINAGATLEFEADSGLAISNTGTLTVNGTTLEPVIFKGRQSTLGYWKGINILSTGNSITNATIRDAGSSTFCCSQNSAAKAGISLGENISDNAAVSVTNTAFINNVYGMYRHSDPTNVFTDGGGNTFSGNTTNKNF